MQRITNGTILETVALNDIEQRTTPAVGHIVERHLLTASRYTVVKCAEHRNKIVYESLAAGIYRLAPLCHLLFKDIHKCRIGLFFRLQQHVALLQRLVVTVEGIDICGVILGYDDVHETPPLVASAINKQCV